MVGPKIDVAQRNVVSFKLSGKQALTSMLRLWLRPLVKLLIRAGYGYRDFNEVVKMTYVEAASAEYGLRGRPTNMSRVAIMTGLTRREVARLRMVLDSMPNALESIPTVAQKVLDVWQTDGRFRNEAGCPRRLPLEGDVSLSALIDEVKGDVPVSAILNELQRADCIEVSRGTASMLRTSYQPTRSEHHALQCLADLAQALTSTSRYEDLVLRDGSGGRIDLADEDVVVLRQMMDTGSRQLIKDLRHWLGRCGH